MKAFDPRNNVYVTAILALIFVLGAVCVATGLEKKDPNYLLKTGKGGDTLVTYQDGRDLPDYSSRMTSDQKRELRAWRRKEKDFVERGVYPKLSRWDY